MQDEPLDDLKRLLSVLMDSVPLGIGVIDRDLRLQYVNAHQARLNGFNAAEVVGRPIADIGPALAAAAGPKIQFVLDTGVPLLKQELVGQHPLDEGRFVHRLVSYYPWRGHDGAVIGVLTTVQDAQVAPFEQQLLEESQQRLLRVLDNLFSFVGVLELDGTLIEANHAPLEAAGMGIDDVRGKKLWDTYWWAHDPAAQTQLQEAVARCRQGEVARYDLQVRMINDSRMWIDFMLAPLKDLQGRITHLIPSATDISLRQASQLALERSEDRYRSIIESSDEAIITKSLDGTITEWNPAASRLLGYCAEEAVGQPVTMIFPASRIAEEARLMDSIRLGQRVPSFETVRVHKNGRLIDVSVTISPLRDRSGTVIGACKLARNITVEKQQRDQISAALEEKTALLHEVHHRVKNNLQIVSSLLNLQARKVSADAALAIGDCQGRIQAMALVHQLLYESENMAEVNLSAYLSRLMVLTQASCATEASAVKLVFTSTAPHITLDNQRTVPCGLLVHELVLNAFKHAFKDAVLSASDTGSGARQPGRIDVALGQTTAGCMQLTVSDNGCGLPAGFAWGGKGGLGTQLVPLFVTQLQGKITTASSSRGARFVIEAALDQHEVSYAV